MRNDFAVTGFNQFAWPLRQYAWPLPPTAELAQPDVHDWYDEMGWMISRLNPADANALCLGVKGGHNDEMHNQNDVGSFMVVSGGKVVLTDPGRGRYSKAYFGPERYANLMASSRGHPVPVINGFEQAEGRQFRATVLAHSHSATADRLDLDMTAAYPAGAGLKALKRSVTLDRATPGGRVLLEDNFEFAGSKGHFQSVLVTPMPAQLEGGAVLIGAPGAGLRVDFDAAALDVAFDRHDGVEKQYQPAVDLIRVVFTPRQPAGQGRLALEISPLA
nr:heparinase II/III family protein [Devosia ureilytica]